MPPQTIVRAGGGGRSVTYSLPADLYQYIQSVLVNVSNGAAAGVRPTLYVETSNGVVIAAKRQGDSIPAGDTGTATWALRLDDEGAGAGGTQGDVCSVNKGTLDANPQTCNNNTATPITFQVVAFDPSGLFSLAQPTRITIQKAAVYTVLGSLLWSGTSNNGMRQAWFRINGVDHYESGYSSVHGTVDGYVGGGTVNMSSSLAAGDYIELVGFQNSGAGRTTAAGSLAVEEVA